MVGQYAKCARMSLSPPPISGRGPIVATPIFCHIRPRGTIPHPSPHPMGVLCARWADSERPAPFFISAHSRQNRDIPVREISLLFPKSPTLSAAELIGDIAFADSTEPPKVVDRCRASPFCRGVAAVVFDFRLSPVEGDLFPKSKRFGGKMHTLRPPTSTPRHLDYHPSV